MSKIIISENENLLKLKKFYLNKKNYAFDCTLELLKQNIISECHRNIKQKILRWADVSNILYYENVELVKYFFYSKLLFRDGYYKASIMLNRSICEMICYELISNLDSILKNNMEELNFRILIKYLTFPWRISEQKYKLFTSKLNEDEIDIINSFYNKQKKFYIFDFTKNQNIRKLVKLYDKIGFYGNIKVNKTIYNRLNKIYDIGNRNIHSIPKSNRVEKDARETLILLSKVIFSLYGIKELNENDILVYGYSDFPELGTTLDPFGIEFFNSPIEAHFGYFNLPTKSQIHGIKKLVGIWDIEWNTNSENNKKGKIKFYVENGILLSKIYYKDNNYDDVEEQIETKLLGNIFELRGFNPSTMMYYKNKNIFFRFKFFNDKTLVGTYNDDNNLLAIAKKEFL